MHRVWVLCPQQNPFLLQICSSCSMLLMDTQPWDSFGVSVERDILFETIRLHVQGFACWKCLLCEPQREPEQLIISSAGLIAKFDGEWGQGGLRCLIF